ncbi:hypothetical protein PS645_04046 [Pseudomonas fluorescens]|uniref:Uncharacterized protein n=1 Tax=Pseudomonas fluorescens TaxID=294 RepID=A0A5E6VDW3_PSEFL|nr:hypothetical protein [Pseudomonas fluorescens]VVN15965.1 hypothetical protein PS645_04046 [Pseudomonas fluorescens]
MNKVSLFCGLIVAGLLLLVHLIVGFVPVGDGAGWDGQLYLQYIHTLGQGDPILNDPYRTIRMSGFLPLILASSIGAPTAGLIWIQLFLNVVMLSTGAALLHDTMLRLNVKQMVATIAVAVLTCSWVFLCMPMFYPVLSDNVALAMVCICLWCWVCSYRWAVYAFCAYFTWVMPGLFLIPFILSALPHEHPLKPESNHANSKLSLWLFALVAMPTSAILLVKIYSVPLSSVIAHGASEIGTTASADMFLLSVTAMLISLLLIIWLGVKLLLDPSTWRSISFRGLIAGGLSVAVSAVLMTTCVDWNGGFKGPPLIDYMFFQSLAAPFKPIIAHFISFGPVILLAISACLAWAFGRDCSIPKALIIICFAFLPLLAYGSETRQWIGVLPIAVVIFAVADFAWLTRVWCLAISAVVFAPSLWMKDYIGIAAKNGMSFQSYQWQFYFGRHGPWMSMTVYQISLIMALGFIAVVILLQRRAKKQVAASLPILK